MLFRLSKPFIHDTLTPRLAVITDLRQGDFLFRPTLQWRATDRLIITTDFDIISGNGQPFKQLDNIDRGSIRFEYWQ